VSTLSGSRRGGGCRSSECEVDGEDDVENENPFDEVVVEVAD
jgi:hypothetical protein